MALSPEKKKRLRDILKSVSTPEEMKKLDDKEVIRKTAGEVTALGEAMQLFLENTDSVPTVVAMESRKTRERTATMEASIAKSLMELSAAIVGKLDEVKQAGYVGSKGQENYALGIQNMAKSLAEGFGSVKKSIDDKPTPVWKWPQYLYSGIRNTSFTPINPSIAPFAITEDYDTIDLEYMGDNLTQATYSKDGTTIAVIVLTYSGDNLISAQRTM